MVYCLSLLLPDWLRTRRSCDKKQVQWVLGFPDDYLAVYLIGLGYPADR